MLDYIFSQQPTKVIRERPGAQSIKGEPEKTKKPKKPKEQPAEQLRMF